MLTLVLGLALAQGPAPAKVAVVQSSNLGVPAKRAVELTRMLVELLTAQKIAPVEGRTPCDNRACLVAAGKELKAQGVISVAYASVGKDTVMDLECVLTGDGNAIAQTTFTVHPADTVLPPEADAFTLDVKRLVPQPLTQEGPPTVLYENDTPKKQKLTPEQPEKPGVVETEGHSRAPAIAMTAAALVAGAVAATCVGIGLSQQGQVKMTSDGVHSPYTRMEAQTLVDSSNRNFTVSAVAGGAAVALAVGAVALFLY